MDISWTFFGNSVVRLPSHFPNCQSLGTSVFYSIFETRRSVNYSLIMFNFCFKVLSVHTSRILDESLFCRSYFCDVPILESIDARQGTLEDGFSFYQGDQVRPIQIGQCRRRVMMKVVIPISGLSKFTCFDLWYLKNDWRCDAS